MRFRATFASVLGLLTVFALAVPALAARPDDGCPVEASGFLRVDGEGWWAGTVAGILEEGLTVEGEAERFGFGDDLEAFKNFVIDGVMTLDKNGNGFLCMKDIPNTPGHPGFIFIANDDVVAA